MSRSLRPITAYPITTRRLEVLKVVDVTPGMRRVTLGGAELAAHTAPNGMPVAAFRSDGVDDEFKLLFRHPDLDEAIGPAQADGVLDWPRDPLMLMRTYTARRWDSDAGELDVDFVMHGIGPATSWARRAQKGETIQIAGPKSSSSHPVGADWILIAGDETALPAIARWLEHWPASARAQVFIEIADDAHRQHVSEPDGVRVTWLSRNGAAAGRSTLLLDALRAATWWPGSPFAWVAGESLSLAPVRRWLRDERGLARHQMEVTGYWRRQHVVASETDPELPDTSQTDDAGEVLHELAELLPPFALRAAVSIGLPAALLDGPSTIGALAETLRVRPAGLLKLCRYLAALQLLRRLDGHRVELTDLGRGLADADHLDLRGRRARRELSGALGLLNALLIETPETPPEGEDAIEDDRDAADELDLVASALAASSLLDGDETILVRGTGAVVIADAIATARPERTVRAAVHPRRGASLQPDRVIAPDVLVEPDAAARAHDDEADVVLLAAALDQLPDHEAVQLLRQAASSTGGAGKVLVFAEMLDEATADEDDYTVDLEAFVLHGSGLRSELEVRDLIASAELEVRAAATIGWGYRLLSLHRSPGPSGSLLR